MPSKTSHTHMVKTYMWECDGPGPCVTYTLTRVISWEMELEVIRVAIHPLGSVKLQKEGAVRIAEDSVLSRGREGGCTLISVGHFMGTWQFCLPRCKWEIPCGC